MTRTLADYGLTGDVFPCTCGKNHPAHVFQPGQFVGEVCTVCQHVKGAHPLSWRDPTLVDQLRALVARWDTTHADWCCRRGCTWPNGQHDDEAAIQALIDGKVTALRVVGASLPTHPCPGACTCDVDNYVALLRALLEEHAGADPT